MTAAAGLGDDSGRQLAAVFGDIDGDGDPDLFVANDKKPNFLFVNNGDGTFAENGAVAGVAYNEEGLAESAMGADLGDYDNDGRLDIIVATYQWLANTLYHNDGDGFFTDLTFAAGVGVGSVPYLGMTAAFVDYDNDGFLDVFVANGHLDENVAEYDPSTTYPQQNQLFRNSGDGSFAEVSDQSGPGMRVERVSHGAIFGDYDNDGDVDFLFPTPPTPPCCATTVATPTTISGSAPRAARATGRASVLGCGRWLAIWSKCGRSALGMAIWAATTCD